MKRKVAFVGSGMIGAGLAVCAVSHGFDISIYDVCPIEESMKRVRDILDTFVVNDVYSREKTEEWMEAIIFTTDLRSAVYGAEMVQECVPENLDLKRKIYREIQEVCGDNTIIASSTSMLFPSALSKGALYPSKIIVGHPFHPSYLLPMIELCAADHEEGSVLDLASDIYSEWGKVPVICRKEVNGFIANTVSWAVMEVCKKHVLEGVCSVEDIDKAIMYGPGLRMAILGQVLSMSMGVPGGFRKMDEKYGKETNPDHLILADGVDEEIANRSVEQGTDEASIARYRDKCLIEFLKIQNLL